MAATSFYSPKWHRRVPVSPDPSPPMTVCSLSDEAHFEWWEVIPHLVLTCIHLIMRYGEELCICVFPKQSEYN